VQFVVIVVMGDNGV